MDIYEVYYRAIFELNFLELKLNFFIILDQNLILFYSLTPLHHNQVY